jgi:glutaminyl-tRNA synthetase
MYDFAHCLSDSIERITHSICTLEFENNRPLYDWIVEQLIEGDRPNQIEFARLNLSYTVLSKRKLIELVETGRVTGWDDPRMPTIAGMRRRGYTPDAIINFCARIGVAKNDNLVDISLLEHCVREDLNEKAPRVMGILRPLRVIIDNYPTGQTEEFECANHPQNPSMGTRMVPFSRELYIERDDFNEAPPKKYKRLGPGREVRLRNSYIVKFAGMVRDEKTGEITEIHCTYDPQARNSPPSDGRKVEGVIHWVSVYHALPVETRLYDRLFRIPDLSAADDDYTNYLNPGSLETLPLCYVEGSLANAEPGERYQFERLGYFCVDLKDSLPGKPVFNRTVQLRDSWSKVAGQ